MTKPILEIVTDCTEIFVIRKLASSETLGWLSRTNRN